MVSYLISSIVKGKTHLYESELTPNDRTVAPRCKPRNQVKRSNTREITEFDFQRHIEEDNICSHCLRYKGDIILPPEEAEFEPR